VDNSFYFFTIILLGNALLESLAAAKSPASLRESKHGVRYRTGCGFSMVLSSLGRASPTPQPIAFAPNAD
jgi:hypothetical protein